MAAPTSAPPLIATRKRLCEIFCFSTDALADLLNEHPDFPWFPMRNQYRFDVAKVQAFLEKLREDEAAVAKVRRDQNLDKARAQHKINLEVEKRARTRAEFASAKPSARKPPKRKPARTPARKRRKKAGAKS